MEEFYLSPTNMTLFFLEVFRKAQEIPFCLEFAESFIRNKI